MCRVPKRARAGVLCVVVLLWHRASSSRALLRMRGWSVFQNALRACFQSVDRALQKSWKRCCPYGQAYRSMSTPCVGPPYVQLATAQGRTAWPRGVFLHCRSYARIFHCSFTSRQSSGIGDMHSGSCIAQETDRTLLSTPAGVAQAQSVQSAEQRPAARRVPLGATLSPPSALAAAAAAVVGRWRNLALWLPGLLVLLGIQPSSAQGVGLLVDILVRLERSSTRS